MALPLWSCGSVQAPPSEGRAATPGDAVGTSGGPPSALGKVARGPARSCYPPHPMRRPTAALACLALAAFPGSGGFQHVRHEVLRPTSLLPKIRVFVSEVGYRFKQFVFDVSMWREEKLAK